MVFAFLPRGRQAASIWMQIDIWPSVKPEIDRLQNNVNERKH